MLKKIPLISVMALTLVAVFSFIIFNIAKADSINPSYFSPDNFATVKYNVYTNGNWVCGNKSEGINASGTGDYLDHTLYGDCGITAENYYFFFNVDNGSTCWGGNIQNCFDEKYPYLIMRYDDNAIFGSMSAISSLSNSFVDIGSVLALVLGSLLLALIALFGLGYGTRKIANKVLDTNAGSDALNFYKKANDIMRNRKGSAGE